MNIRYARAGRALLDLAALSSSWLLAYVLRYELPLPVWAQRQLLYGVPFAVLLQFAMLRGIGTHRDSWRHTSLREVLGVGQAIVLAGAVLFALRLVVPAFTDTWPKAAYLSLPRSALVIQSMAALIGLVAVRGLRRLHVQYLETGRAFVAGTRRVLLVGAGRVGVRVAREYNERPDLRVRVIGFLDDDLGLQGMLVGGVPVLGRIDDLPDVARDRWPDEVVLTLNDPTESDVRRVVDLATRADVTAHVPPAFATEPTGMTGPIDLRRIDRAARPVDLPPTRTSRDLIHDLTKRGLDLVLGSVLALVATPLILVLALAQAVNLRTTRPFFVQDRIGQYGRLFRFPKIRTLPPQAPAYALKPEIHELPLPWLSRVMRRLHLDELPQLYLVLTGEMSLVGPRPKMPDDHEPVEIGYSTARTLVPQGCTCLWQVGAHTDVLPSDTPDYDFFYLQHRSIRLDLWILWRTGLQVLGLGRDVELERMPRWVLDPDGPAPASAARQPDAVGTATPR